MWGPAIRTFMVHFNFSYVAHTTLCQVMGDPAKHLTVGALVGSGSLQGGSGNSDERRKKITADGFTAPTIERVSEDHER